MAHERLINDLVVSPGDRSLLRIANRPISFPRFHINPMKQHFSRVIYCYSDNRVNDC